MSNDNGDWPVVPRQSPPASLASDPTADLLTQIPNLLTGAAMPAHLLQVFPQLLSKLAKYPRLSKLFSLALTLVAASYFNAGKLIDGLSSMWSWFISTFTASVTMGGDDPFMHQLRAWLRKVKLYWTGTSMYGESSYLIKQRDHEEHEYDDDDNYDDDGNRIESKDSSNNDEENAFRLVLHSKSNMHMFRYKGRYFLVRKEGNENLYDPGACKSMTFYCFGWSTKPIYDMLSDIYKSQKGSQQKRWTSIRTTEENSYGQWSRPTNRLARPISTVDLDEGQKDMIVTDIQEYLDPATKDWYHSNGIPYRRGYLFYGPPGTGKSSLATAIAGHFNLDIHIIGLLDKNMNDYTLGRLMKSMTGRPLVLLEDIDSAGVGREFDEDDSDDESLKGWSQARKLKPKSGVTLSGLLNAIDGVGAQEGQVLIMTTNHIEVLDDALIRAGRVDLRVKLNWSSRSQARDIFMRMYSMTTGPKSGPKATPKCACSAEPLEAMATKFADQIPEYELSPAELQDFMLMRKNKPEQAVADVGDWATKLVKEKKDAAEAEEKRKEEKRKKKQQKKKKNKKKLAFGEDSDDDDDVSEDGEGQQTPPPSFEDVEKEKKENLLRWFVKQLVYGSDPIPVNNAQEV